MTGTEEGGTVFKLWKDEDYPQAPEPQATEQPVEQEIPANDPPAPVETPQEPVVQEQPEVKESSLDIDRIIQERLGKPVDAVKSELERLSELEKFIAENKEFIADDDFSKNLVKSWKGGGKSVLEKYIEAMSVDYSKLSPEQLVEHSVRKRVGNDAPKSVLESEYKRELQSMGWSEDLEPGTPEHQRFQEYIAWKAGQLKEQFVAEQNNFKVPERQQKAVEPEIDQKAIEAYVLQTKTNPDTLALLERKAVKIGDFQLPANPESLVNQALDTSLLLSKFVKQDGTPDYNKFYQVSAIVEIGPEEFYRKAVAEAVAAEKLKWIAATRNPSEPEPKAASTDAPFRVKFME